MRLLIIGGTVFLGRHLAEQAVARGDAVTMFNRGRSAPEAPAGAEQIHGDREHDLDRLDGRSWDAVIDTCGYVPRIVRESARRLADRTNHYTFVSSISAYGSFARIGIDEQQPTAELPDGHGEDVGRFYGELKAACEREVLAAVGDRGLIVRSGLLVGPGDPTERFTYWVRRIAEGGRVLVPAVPAQPVQWIDARDIAHWILQLAEAGTGGTFNATGPSQGFGAMLEEITRVTGSGAGLTWVGESELFAAGVEPWSDLPLWLGLGREPEMRGFMSADVGRALAAGLAPRPLSDTVAATLAWIRERPGIPGKGFGVPLEPAGLAPEREHELLTRLTPTSSLQPAAQPEGGCGRSRRT
jgi:2'-hydroxyisoflavone reductase